MGLPHSEIMHKNGIVFEEYAELFDDGKFYEYGDYLISHQIGNILRVPVEFIECIVSPDNMGGYFITAKII